MSFKSKHSTECPQLRGSCWHGCKWWQEQEISLLQGLYRRNKQLYKREVCVHRRCEQKQSDQVGHLHIHCAFKTTRTKPTWVLLRRGQCWLLSFNAGSVKRDLPVQWILRGWMAHSSANTAEWLMHSIKIKDNEEAFNAQANKTSVTLELCKRKWQYLCKQAPWHMGLLILEQLIYEVEWLWSLNSINKLLSLLLVASRWVFGKRRNRRHDTDHHR